MINTKEILSELNLKEDMSGAEFGCGAAHFALDLAKKLSKGTVYALDIQEEKLSALRGKVALEKLHNVRTILCDLENEQGSTLHTGSLDVILIPNVLFQSENRTAIMKEAQRVLKKGGELLVIDWQKQGSFHKETIVSPDEIKKIAQTLGLRLKKERGAGEYHYALFFVK